MKILFVCLGNICRSPMAEFVMKEKLKEKNIGGVEVQSAGIIDYHEGEDLYSPARRCLESHGIFPPRHQSRPITRADYSRFDLIVGMDDQNVRDMLDVFGGDASGKIKKLTDFSHEGNSVADPWYTRDFERTYSDVCKGTEALCEYIVKQGKQN